MGAANSSWYTYVDLLNDYIYTLKLSTNLNLATIWQVPVLCGTLPLSLNLYYFENTFYAIKFLQFHLMTAISNL